MQLAPHLGAGFVLAGAAWQLFATGESNGIELDFEYNEDFEDIDFER